LRTKRRTHATQPHRAYMTTTPGNSRRYISHSHAHHIYISITSNPQYLLVHPSASSILVTQSHNMSSTQYSAPIQNGHVSTLPDDEHSLAIYARTMHQHTKKQMDAASRAARRRSHQDRAITWSRKVNDAAMRGGVPERGPSRLRWWWGVRG
jgi:hypothetical protein